MTETVEPVLLDIDVETGIGTVTFNRPSVFNALDLATAEAFEKAVAVLAARRDVRCVVLTGAGKAFMAGGDVAAFAADLDHADRLLSRLLDHMHPALLALRAMDAPVVAAVNGVAAGAGFSLALAADYVLAHPASRFVLAYDKLGVAPDCGGSWFLARKIGRAKAFELMLMGAALSAADAQAAGIVNLVTGEDDFADSVRASALHIAQGPTRAFGMFKRLMDVEQPLAAHLDVERDGFVAAMATEDFRHAATSFVNKQAPVYKGK